MPKQEQIEDVEGEIVDGELEEKPPNPPSEDPQPETPETPPEAVSEPEDAADGGPDDFKPHGEALIVREPEDLYRAMDAEDELLMLDELQERQLTTWVYEITISGRKVHELSVVGVNECVRTANRHGAGIRISSTPPVVNETSEDGKDYYRVMVYAEDASGNGDWGVSTEPKMMAKRNGGVMWDKFALTKAINKASRNAKRKLIPEEVAQHVIGQALGKPERVKQLKRAAEGQMSELPPPLDTKKAKAKVDKIRKTYDAIKAIDRSVLPPGRFNAYLTRAEHSYDRLDDLQKHLDDELVKLQNEEEK